VSELGLGAPRTSHRAARKQSKGCLPALIALALIVALGVFAYVKGVDLLRDALNGSSAADYAGDGTGTVTIEVQEGDTATDIAHTLEAAGVVKSAEAFIDAANANPQSTSIQVGFYALHSKMSAESALDLMLDPDTSMVTNNLTIPEGKRANEIVALVSEFGGWSENEVQKAYDDTKALGLPAYANGDPEGYLFPATYDVPPKATPASVLKTMVDEFKRRADELKLEQGAADLGMSPGDVVTVASLIQAEASRPEDMPNVASVIYNRLDIDMPLQLDSTLHYAVDSRGEIQTTDDLRDMDTPYNSYTLTGLPPTPIDSPGMDALDAALHPANTDYLYFVTVNLKTGETKFAETFAEHEQNRQEYLQYCETSDEC
jgi:UPF0755 protein